MKKSTKKLLVAMVATLFSATVVMAQAPQAIAYQAAARNGKGVVIAFKQVGLRFTVLDTIAGARNIVYQETMPATTNALGLFMVNIGQGIPTSTNYSFSNINWGATASMYIQVELDTTGYHPTGQSLYAVIGTQQLMSAPYALYSNMAGNGVPVGTIEAYAGPTSTIPLGWALCDGRTVSQTGIYANLFAIINTSWGVGDGSGTTFSLPDTRGLFLRGVDNSPFTGYAGRDPSPDVNNRGSILTGGNTGNNVGSYEGDVFANHSHGVNDPGHSHTIGYPYGAYQFSGICTNGGCSYQIDLQHNTSQSSNVKTGISIQGNGGNETRPRNAAVYYIIKY